MTYSEIIAHEPRIAEIIDAVKPSRSERLRYRQYEKAKSELFRLVGWGAACKDLRTTEAYEVVIRRIARKLKI